MNAIEIYNISKTYKKYYKGVFYNKVEAVKNLSFSVEKGSVTGFIGPNGAGKTSTIKMIFGIIKKDSGEIRINGISNEKTDAKKKIAYMPEQPYFYRHLSIYETLKFHFELSGTEKDFFNKHADEIIEKCELTSHLEKKVFSLSKGLQQRLNLACVLITDPEIIVCDEPMSGLDPLGRRLFRKIFGEISQKGVSVFFSTHILEDIESLCSKIVVLSKGEKLYEGSISKLLENSIEEYDLRISDIYKQKIPESMLPRAKKIEEGFILTVDTTEKEDIVKLLLNSGVFPDTIEPKRKSLDTILYGKESETGVIK